MESGETSSWTSIKISRSRVRAADSDTSVDNISLDDCLSLNYQPVEGVYHFLDSTISRSLLTQKGRGYTHALRF